MNYRHIYHAGNRCDVVKHITLLILIRSLQRKDAPVMVLDTHAGCGIYDLTSAAASKTTEAATGVQTLWAQQAALSPLLADYLALLTTYNPALPLDNSTAAALRFYPGSPALLRYALRPQDRAILCELHPEDYQQLRTALPPHTEHQLHHRNGYEAMGAFLPPPERRGLVLIDPPYEQPDEYERLTAALKAAYRRWPQGCYAVWYPLKHRDTISNWQRAIAATGMRKQYRAEYVFAPVQDGTLYGSGMFIINPPWQTPAQITAAYAALHTLWPTPYQGAAQNGWLVGE